MNDVTDVFESRKNEIEVYFNVLNTKLLNSNNDEINIMRATAILLLYGMVESTITSMFTNYYKFLTGKKFNEVNETLRTLYIDLKLSDCDAKSANYQAYIRKSKEIIGNIINGDYMLFAHEKLQSISNGNLGDTQIRELFIKHGINITGILIHPCFGKIKEDRNALSHGRKTFDEVGRDLDLDDLKKYKDDIIDSLTELINIIDLQTQ